MDKELIDKYKLNLTKKIARTISYQFPASANIEHADQVQTIIYHRIAEVDPFNPTEPDYGLWRAEDQAIWPEIITPTYEGLKASKITIPLRNVTENDHDEHIVVHYSFIKEFSENSEERPLDIESRDLKIKKENQQEQDKTVLAAQKDLFSDLSLNSKKGTSIEASETSPVKKKPKEVKKKKDDKRIKENKTKDYEQQEEIPSAEVRNDFERNFAHLADMHTRPIILSNEYAYLRNNNVVANVLGQLAQTGEINYVPVQHNWNREDYDWGDLF